jgi:hypothetical protein
MDRKNGQWMESGIKGFTGFPPAVSPASAPTATTMVWAKTTAGIQASLKLFGVVGPFFGFGPYLLGEVSSSGTAQHTKLSYGFELAWGAETKILNAGVEKKWTFDLASSTPIYDKDVIPVVLAPPSNVNATKGSMSTCVRVTWSPVPGAAQYRVYRAPMLSQTSATLLGTTGGTSLDDTSAEKFTKYIYYVASEGEYDGKLSNGDCGFFPYYADMRWGTNGGQVDANGLEVILPGLKGYSGGPTGIELRAPATFTFSGQKTFHFDVGAVVDNPDGTSSSHMEVSVNGQIVPRYSDVPLASGWQYYSLGPADLSSGTNHVQISPIDDNHGNGALRIDFAYLDGY